MKATQKRTYNEAEAVFKADCREKKRNARGARNRVRNTKGCNLPTRTPSEIAQMTGPCKQYNLDVAATLDQFEDMSTEIQAEYLALLAKRFGAREENLPELFNSDVRTVHSMLQRNALTGIMKRSGAGNAFDEPAWAEFITKRGNPVQVDMSYAVKLKDVRVQLGLTQRQLAEKLGCTQATISRAENQQVSDSSVAPLVAKVAKLLKDRGMELVPVRAEQPVTSESSSSNEDEKTTAACDNAAAEKKGARSKRGNSDRKRGAIVLSGSSADVAEAIAKLLKSEKRSVTITVQYD